MDLLDRGGEMLFENSNLWVQALIIVVGLGVCYFPIFWLFWTKKEEREARKKQVKIREKSDSNWLSWRHLILYARGHYSRSDGLVVDVKKVVEFTYGWPWGSANDQTMLMSLAYLLPEILTDKNRLIGDIDSRCWFMIRDMVCRPISLTRMEDFILVIKNFLFRLDVSDLDLGEIDPVLEEMLKQG
jgi:hypothetical protein